MTTGDLVKIVTSTSEIFAIVIKDNDPTGWLAILDFSGNTLWWPPEEMIKINAALEIVNPIEGV